MLDGDTTEHILTETFIKTRAKSLSVTADFYKEKAQELLQFASQQEKYEEIRLVTGHRRAARVCGESHAAFSVHPSCKYVRLEVVNGSKRAYTNAYPVSELLGE